MKKTLALFLCAAFMVGVLAFAGCSSSSLETIKRNGEIVMYTNAAFPPFEYMKGEEVAGVDVDIAQAIADDLGVKLTIKNVEFDSIIGSIKSGKADIGAAGISVTDERLKEVDFSSKYVKSTQYIILPEATEVATIEQLAGLKIGVQTGTTGDLTITGEVEAKEGYTGVLKDTGAEVLYYNSALDATIAMQAGKIDAVVIDELPAKNIAAVQDGLKAIELVYADGSNTEEEYAICVKKGNQELLDAINKTLDRLIQEGKVDEFVLAHTAATVIE